ncbi:zinc ribbon domain-containing protein [Novosphingobium sp. Chol11]|uniref:zinc ribbon domain-containing protein n=1 Tax=Novosphingobium sp. Chol11 TaxID=1385763 RepID=UPI0025F73088|nr:zinc ribbon domain-containing protein [Novosphingobium sp. Chol11]
MAIIKGVRGPERVYTAVFWLVSVVFAGFIIGLGNLVIGDLPLVDAQVLSAPAPENPALATMRRQLAANNGDIGKLDLRLELAQLQLTQAQRASANGTDTFRAWIAARDATTNPQQDPEVLSRTRQLEALKANEAALEGAIAELENQRLPLGQRAADIAAQLSKLESDAAPAQERARFWQELRVFGLRLALTLPMLVAAVWLVARQRSSDYWPLMRGFVLAAVFVFFVELVPYLPSYGGYVRYGVGIILTFAAGQFLIRNMRSYLAGRQAAEQEQEQERRRRVGHDEAFKKMAAKTCPGCDRPIATTGEAETNFCVHCGMTLFDHCRACNTRKMAFFRYCMACGVPTEDTRSTEQAAPSPA